MLLSSIAVAVAMVMAGCSAAGQGSASIYVRDAATDDFSQVHVVFTDIRVHRSGGDIADDDDDNETDDDDDNETDENDDDNKTSDDRDDKDDDGQGGWIILFHNATGVDVDLLDTNATRAAFLGETNLTAGKYQQFRIEVASAYGIDHNGTRVEIKVPSHTLKFVESFEVDDGQETRIVLDFDLDKSLKQTGNGAWMLLPVLGKTRTDFVDDDKSGRERHGHAGEVEDFDDDEDEGDDDSDSAADGSSEESRESDDNPGKGGHGQSDPDDGEDSGSSHGASDRDGTDA